MTSLTHVPFYPEPLTVEQVEEMGRREALKSTMKPFQERVIEEKKSLDDKISPLRLFIERETFKTLPVEEQDRMKRQLHIMEEYSIVLGERIENFE